MKGEDRQGCKSRTVLQVDRDINTSKIRDFTGAIVIDWKQACRSNTIV